MVHNLPSNSHYKLERPLIKTIQENATIFLGSQGLDIIFIMKKFRDIFYYFYFVERKYGF